VVVVFSFFFFLSEQVIAALNMESWARCIVRKDDIAVCAPASNLSGAANVRPRALSA
jgi:hypothetical protein